MRTLIPFLTHGLFSQEITNPRKQKVNQTSPYGWLPSKPSEYFGRLKTPVTVMLKNGEIKKMKLKTALQKGLQFVI